MIPGRSVSILIGTLALIASQVAHPSLIHSIDAHLVTVDSPTNHVVSSGGTLDGVGDLILSLTTGGAIRCSSSLLPTGRHLLTAGHCVTNGSGVLDVSSATVTFARSSGNFNIAASSFTKHPDWDGSLLAGNDIAIVELSQEAPADVDRYDLYTASTEVGLLSHKVGFGQSGTGNTGATLGSGTKREGFNVYDSTADLMLTALGFTPGVDFVAGSVLHYDFDNGLAANDAFGFFFGLADLGLGTDEVNSAPGDSGGPTFIDGLIAGVTSYGVSLQFNDGSTADVDQPASTNSSFGEFSGDTRVSHYADWVYDTIGFDPNANDDPPEDPPTFTDVPAPTALSLLAFAIPWWFNSGRGRNGLSCRESPHRG